MLISFSPVRHPYNLALTVQDERIVQIGIGGDDQIVIDLIDLQDGAVLPAGAVDCEWIAGPISRIDGELHLTIRLPHGPLAPETTRFPQPIHVTEDGNVAVPEWGDDPAAETAAAADGIEMTSEEYAAYVAEHGEPSV